MPSFFDFNPANFGFVGQIAHTHRVAGREARIGRDIALGTDNVARSAVRCDRAKVVSHTA